MFHQILPSKWLAAIRTTFQGTKRRARAAYARSNSQTVAERFELRRLLSASQSVLPGVTSHLVFSNGELVDVADSGRDITTHGGTPVAGPWGDAGTAIQFNGQNEFIELDSEGLPSGGEERTVAVRVRADRLNNNPVFFSMGSNVAGRNFGIRAVHGKLQISLWGSRADLNTHYRPKTGEWLHLAATYDGNVVRAFVNGNQVGQKTVGRINTLLADRATIGQLPQAQNGNTFSFDGTVAEVVVLKRAASAGEMKQLAATRTQAPAADVNDDVSADAIIAAVDELNGLPTSADALPIIVRDDPEAPGAKIIEVNGTAANDTIRLRHNKHGHVVVTLVSEKTGDTLKVIVKERVTRFVAEGADGNDDIEMETRSIRGFLSGGKGDDILVGGKNDDILDGGEGQDDLKGKAGDDAISGGLGADTLGGGKGKDTLDGGEGRDEIRGGDGVDTVENYDNDDVHFQIEKGKPRPPRVDQPLQFDWTREQSLKRLDEMWERYEKPDKDTLYSPDNVSFDNKGVTLHAHSDGGRPVSAGLKSTRPFLYGTFEFQAFRVAKKSGLHSSVWLFAPNAYDGKGYREIDGLERLKDGQVVMGVFHAPNNDDPPKFGEREPKPFDQSRPHTVTVIWEPERIIWKVDGKQIGDALDIRNMPRLRQEMFVRIDLNTHKDAPLKGSASMSVGGFKYTPLGDDPTDDSDEPGPSEHESDLPVIKKAINDRQVTTATRIDLYEHIENPLDGELKFTAQSSSTDTVEVKVDSRGVLTLTPRSEGDAIVTISASSSASTVQLEFTIKADASAVRARVSELSEQLEALADKNSQARKEISSANELMTAINQKRKSIENSVAKKTEGLHRLRSQLNVAEKELSTAQADVNRVSDQSSSAAATLRNAESSLQNARRTYQNLDAQTRSLFQRKRTLENEIATLSSRIQRTSKQRLKNSLKTERATKKAELSRVTSQWRNSQAQRSAAERDKNSAISAREQAKRALDSVNKRLSNVRDTLASAKRVRDQLAQNVSKKEAALAPDRSALDDLREQLKTVRKKLSNAGEVIDEIVAKHTQITTELSRIRTTKWAGKLGLNQAETDAATLRNGVTRTQKEHTFASERADRVGQKLSAVDV